MLQNADTPLLEFGSDRLAVSEIFWKSNLYAADAHPMGMACGGLMFLICPSVCVCVGACGALVKAFSDRLVVDLTDADERRHYSATQSFDVHGIL